MLKNNNRGVQTTGDPRNGAFVQMKTISLLRLERVLFVVGGILLVVAATARIHGELSARWAIQVFEAAQSNAQTKSTVDMSQWSAQRIRDYRESLGSKSDPPMAVLHIPKLNLEVPIFDGTDELTLNRGAGRIIGTARLGEVGNVGIAAHRDGFFRGLQDVGAGDAIELRLPDRTERYTVTGLQITTPEDVSVLKPTAKASLTLVTCYPFYFVGSAPQRYIVHAAIRGADESNDDLVTKAD